VVPKTRNQLSVYAHVSYRRCGRDQQAVAC
jgi:hypothetical protein